ncbi:uncharacterized protein AKAME5_002678700 [Lates japonicus]|uniref:Uncharacterized protein n=1 Tax=Lates japonicus TaxID=270547 RepID=A0AAD3RNG9_LATJO|nr:uncharacterized protein AKAME5_002678700 [Lates japonicus]
MIINQRLEPLPSTLVCPELVSIRTALFFLFLHAVREALRPPGTDIRHELLKQSLRISDCDGECASSLTTVRSTHVTDVTKSKPSDTGHVTSLILNGGAGGGAGPHGRPEGIDLATQTENGDSIDGRSGPSEAGGEAWSQRSKKVGSSSEMGDTDRQSEVASVLSVESEVRIQRLTSHSPPSFGLYLPQTSHTSDNLGP